MVCETWLSIEWFGRGMLFCAPYGFSQENCETLGAFLPT